MNDSVSIAKAIGIFLMVLGHAGLWDSAINYIAMFHMPLFFFMSGFCFKEKYLTDMRTFVKKRITGVWWPYVKWGVIFLLFHNLFFHLNIYSDVIGFQGKVEHLYSWSEYWSEFIGILKMRAREPLLGGYWFLASLFWGSIIFLLTRKFINNKWIQGGGILTVCIFMFVTKCQIPFFGVGGRAFLAAIFIWIGAEMSRNKKLVANFINNKILCFLGFIFVGVGSIYWHSSMLKMTAELVIPYCITAIFGTLGIYAISKWIDNKYANTSIGKFLCFTGNHTLEILTWHLLLFKIVNLLIVHIYNLPVENLAQFPVYVEYARKGWIVLYFIVGCGIPLVGCWVYEKIRW